MADTAEPAPVVEHAPHLMHVDIVREAGDEYGRASKAALVKLAAAWSQQEMPVEKQTDCLKTIVHSANGLWHDAVAEAEGACRTLR